MSVAVMKSKAEQGLSDAFAQVADTLPGSKSVKDARSAALKTFEDLGLPHRRIEEWKYTDLRNQMKEALPVSGGDERSGLTVADVIVALGPMAHLEADRMVFVDGRYRADLSSLQGSDAITVAPLAEVLAGEGGKANAIVSQSTVTSEAAVMALNTAYMTDGAVISLAAGAVLEKPLMLVHMRGGTEPRFAAVRHTLNVGAGASGTLIEAFVALPGASADAQINTATHVVVGDGARVHHIKLAAEDGATTHLSNWMVEIGQEATYRGFQQTQGVRLARNHIFAVFQGEDSAIDLSGTFLGAGRDHIDTTLVVHHNVPGCESRELFKGVLKDQARGVFQGKVVVQPIAQKTDGKQMAQALMLSPDAEFDSKPELEIYADDVACGHGSTVAEIDDDLMFYCKSRGIPEDTARVLMTESFVAEAIEQVEPDAVREALEACARQWLEGATVST